MKYRFRPEHLFGVVFLGVALLVPAIIAGRHDWDYAITELRTNYSFLVEQYALALILAAIFLSIDERAQS